MSKDSIETRAEIMEHFPRGDTPQPGPLRWLVDGRSDAHPILQQQWIGTVTGKRIWVDVPTDEPTADEKARL